MLLAALDTLDRKRIEAARYDGNCEDLFFFIETMLEEAAGLTDATKRADIYKQIQQRVLKDLVVVPLVDTVTYDAKRAEVTGETLDALASYMWLYDVQIKK